MEIEEQALEHLWTVYRAALQDHVQNDTETKPETEAEYRKRAEKHAIRAVAVAMVKAQRVPA